MRAIVEGGDHAFHFSAERDVASINAYGRASCAGIQFD
jgi:hypothetical protein